MTLSRNSTTSTFKSHETLLAIRNSIKLFISLLITLSIAFIIRFWMPKFLGPNEFGILHFSEGFAAMFFIFASLGAETYIRKEVAVRIDHASEFFGVLVVTQFLISVLLTLIMTAVLYVLGKDAQVFRVVYWFTAGQFFMTTNSKLIALLQAKGSVDENAIVNSISKVLWGAGIFLGLYYLKDLEIVGIVFFLTECLKTPIFFRACRKHLDLAIQIDWPKGMAMLIASFPFFMNSLAHTIASKVDVLMLSALTVDQEVGWYGAAGNVNLMVLLIMPVLMAVVTPMSARIATQGEEELNKTMRAMIRLMLALTAPLALLVSLNARDIILLLLSSEYLPSVGMLRIQASIVPVIFMNTVMAIQLIQLGKIWNVTKISFIALLINPILNGILIVPVYHLLGNGGGGLAAAFTTFVTEFTVLLMFFKTLRGSSFDRQTGKFLLRLSALCGIYFGIHFILKSVGIWRGPIEVILYPAIAIPFGVLPMKEFIFRAKLYLAERRKSAQ